MKFKNILLLCLISFLFTTCTVIRKATTYDFPKPVDTTDKPIEYQEKKLYGDAEMGVYADIALMGQDSMLLNK